MLEQNMLEQNMLEQNMLEQNMLEQNMLEQNMLEQNMLEQNKSHLETVRTKPLEQTSSWQRPTNAGLSEKEREFMFVHWRRLNKQPRF
jgi:hypothetical protein